MTVIHEAFQESLDCETRKTIHRGLLLYSFQMFKMWVIAFCWSVRPYFIRKLLS